MFANPDGSFTAVEHLRPVRVRRDNGWVDPDTTLVKRPDGTIGPRAATVGLSLSAGGDAPMVRMSRAGRELSLTWPGRLPEPELSGDSAIYRDVFKDVDLVVRADVDGFAHTLVVKTREAAANRALSRLTFGLGSAGLSIRTREGDTLEAVDQAGGGTLFEAPKAIMWDSRTAAEAAGTPTKTAGTPIKATGTPPKAQAEAAPGALGELTLDEGPAETSKVADLDVTVEGDNLTLIPDQDLLTAPDTQFPVYIDPTWVTVKSSAWAGVSSAYPSTSYYKFSGKADHGVGRCPNDAKCASTTDVKRVFYRMPTSAYAGKHIISAEFIVRETWSYNCTATGVQLWRTKAFTDKSTWNSTKDHWTERLDTRTVAKGWSASCPAGDVEFNATKAVKDAVAGNWSTITFGLRASSESSVTGWKRFAGNASLRVHYNTPPPQPKMSNLSMSPGGKCVSSPPAAVRVPPTLSAVLYDPDSGQRKEGLRGVRRELGR